MLVRMVLPLASIPRCQTAVYLGDWRSAAQGCYIKQKAIGAMAMLPWQAASHLNLLRADPVPIRRLDIHVSATTRSARRPCVVHL